MGMIFTDALIAVYYSIGKAGVKLLPKLRGI
jgi:hypothetical protein